MLQIKMLNLVSFDLWNFRVKEKIALIQESGLER